MNFVRSDEVEAIRKQLDHPVIDGDGHLIEYNPLVRDFLVEIAGEDVAASRADALGEKFLELDRHRNALLADVSFAELVNESSDREGTAEDRDHTAPPVQAVAD